MTKGTNYSIWVESQLSKYSEALKSTLIWCGGGGGGGGGSSGFGDGGSGVGVVFGASYRL